MAERILCFSDIHGRARDAEQALRLARYNPDRDYLVYLGDAIDRGPESREAVRLLRGLAAHGAVVLRGNHEDMLRDYLENPELAGYYLRENNGGMATLRSYGCQPGRISPELAADCEWLNRLPA